MYHYGVSVLYNPVEFSKVRFRWTYKKALEFITSIRPRAAINDNFLGQLKLIQSICLSDFNWNLSTTWSNTSDSYYDNLMRNTYLNSRKGEIVPLIFEDIASNQVRLRSPNRKSIVWNLVSIDRSKKLPLPLDVFKTKEILKQSYRKPTSILSSKKKKSFKIKGLASNSFCKFIKPAGQDESSISVSPNVTKTHNFSITSKISSCKFDNQDSNNKGLPAILVSYDNLVKSG